MNISVAGLALIEEFEGYSYNAYWDPWGHVWTVGYGQTHGVGPGSTMTREQAAADLKGRVASDYAPAITGLGVPLSQHQFDALCSFVWNLGPGSMQWDVGRYLRARDYNGAANAMLGYDRAGGAVLAGLVRRRQAERTLFLTPDPHPTPADTHHYERFVDSAFPYKNGFLNERGVAREYDALRQHPFVHRPRLGRLRAQLDFLAKRVAYMAHQEHPDVSVGQALMIGPNHRGWRFQQLLARSKGEVR